MGIYENKAQATMAKANSIATLIFWLGLIAGVAWLFWYLGGGSGLSSGSAEQQQDGIWVAKAQEDVRAALKDGSSAEFRAVRISRRDGAPYVCGEVNAKNSFGGRGGYQRFVYAGSLGVVIEEQLKPGQMREVWQQFCSG